MTAPSVEAAIHELMDLAWNLVSDLLKQRGLLGDGLLVQEYTKIHSWVEDLTRYTVVHSREVAVLFMDTRPVDAIVFHHDLQGADDPTNGEYQRCRRYGKDDDSGGGGTGGNYSAWIGPTAGG
jgi:hypothetical protein